MPYLKSTLLLILCSVFIFGCQNDDEIIPPDTTPTVDNEIVIDQPIDLFQGNLSGIILDRDLVPIGSATVQVGIELTETDENGYFNFVGISMDANGTIVRISKTGYLSLVKLISPSKTALSSTKIVLSEVEAVQNFSANEEVNLIFAQQNIEIDFEENSFTDLDGAAYSGEVSIQLNYLNPSDPLMTASAPGDFRAFNQDSELRVLESYGMFSIDIFDAAGNELKLAEDKSATIKYHLPNNLISSVPSSMPLWHFDETSGYWLEEGEATLEGETLVGTVSHFSWWNFDVPFPLVTLTGTIVSPSGMAVEQAAVSVQLTSSAQTFGYIYTDSDGNFQGYVPANESLILKCYDECLIAIYEEEFQTSEMDLVIDQIVLPQSDLIEICGVLVDCDQLPVSNGYVLVKFSQSSIFINVNEQGEFCQNIINCDENSFELIGVDLENLLQSNPQVFQTADSPFALSQVLACDQIPLFFKYTIEGVEVEVQNFSVGQLGEELFFQDNDNFENVQGFLSSYNWGEPDFSVGYFSIDLTNEVDVDATTDHVIVEMIEYNGVGEYFYIKFTGVDSSNNTSYSVELSAILE